MSLVARLLDPKDALTTYDDLFTDEFIRQSQRLAGCRETLAFAKGRQVPA